MDRFPPSPMDDQREGPYDPPGEELHCDWCDIEVNEDELFACERCGESICDWCGIDDDNGNLICEDCYADAQLEKP